MTDPAIRCWGVVPAAGIGSRMGGGIPKQYLEIAGTSLIEYSLGVLLACDWIEAVAVALHPEDRWAPGSHWLDDRRVLPVQGGEARMDSVLAGLRALGTLAGSGDWVLVHDAARPCVQVQEVQALRERVLATGVGGILAAPMVDTVKRADAAGRVLETLDRDSLWRAQTPQMFPLAALTAALGEAADQGLVMTDEAAAMEWAGHPVQLVAGSQGNIKVTLPEDLEMAQWLLDRQLNRESGGGP